MKTWIRLYDMHGNKYDKDFTLNGKWSREGIKRFIERRENHLSKPVIKITYLKGE